MSRYNCHKICCVPQCTHSAVKGKVSLHTFPHDERMKKEWVIKLPIGKAVMKAMRVCSEHFQPEDFFCGATVNVLYYILVPALRFGLLKDTVISIL